MSSTKYWKCWKCAKQRSKQTYIRKRKRHNKLPQQNVVVEGVEEEVAEEILEEAMQDVGIIEEYNTSASFDKVELIAAEGVNNIFCCILPCIPRVFCN